jgi:predicted ribosome quality control (RQC) complex YloA/Tae2 family protein
VYVDGNDQLGTLTSSLRFKQDVEDMGDATQGLMRLRPVTFRYKPEYDDGSHLLEYGLIAEEVAKVYPELVQTDRSGKPLAVRSHFVNAMVLNEVQRQHRTIATQQERIEQQQTQIEELQRQVRALLRQRQPGGGADR